MKKKIFYFFIPVFFLLCYLYLTQLSFDWSMLSILVPDFRLPRLIAIGIAAIALGLSGLIVQTVTENPLADSGTLGITSGASAGVVTGLLLIHLLKLSESWKLIYPLFAILGALLAFSLIYFLMIRRGATNSKILLFGIGLMALFQGYITIAQLSMNSFDFEQVAVWLAGEPWQLSWGNDLWSLLALVICLFILGFFIKKLEILSLGEEVAESLGLNYRKTARSLLGLSLFLSIISVLLVGGLAFIGLIAPHIARRLTGFKMRFRLIVTALIAMILVLAADLFAQVIIAPSSLPLGFIVAFIAAPYYIYLIQKE